MSQKQSWRTELRRMSSEDRTVGFEYISEGLVIQSPEDTVRQFVLPEVTLRTSCTWTRTQALAKQNFG